MSLDTQAFHMDMDVFKTHFAEPDTTVFGTPEFMLQLFITLENVLKLLINFSLIFKTLNMIMPLQWHVATLDNFC